jgi:hypothetical protein
LGAGIFTSPVVDVHLKCASTAGLFLLLGEITAMNELLQEYADSRGVTLRVDRAAGVLRGIKLIGLESQNGRRYRPAALAAAVALYEGAKVNVNHPHNGPLAPRDYRDRLGVVRQVEFRPGDGLFANLHFNPKHALAEQLVWDAENNPRNVGFSHNVMARLSRDASHTIVEAITHVQSVDLVADPAATQGLFEQEQQAALAGSALPIAVDEVVEPAPSAPSAMASLTLEELRVGRPDLLEAHAAEATASLRLQLEEALVREAATRGRPKSMEQSAAVVDRRASVATARDFARAISGPRGRFAIAGPLLPTLALAAPD